MDASFVCDVGKKLMRQSLVYNLLHGKRNVVMNRKQLIGFSQTQKSVQNAPFVLKKIRDAIISHAKAAIMNFAGYTRHLDAISRTFSEQVLL